jgi:hypothetical protein
MNLSAGHAKVSTLLKIIADAIGFENMQAAFEDHMRFTKRMGVSLDANRNRVCRKPHTISG